MRKSHLFAGVVAVAAALAVGGQANADTVTWAQWTSPATSTGETSGVAKAIMGGINVTYTGEVQSVVADYPSWTPPSTYTDSPYITNAPPQSGGIVQLFGGSSAPYVTGTDTITFSAPVANPVMAIWSLGASGDSAQFDFTSSEPFVKVAGGPSFEYNGSSITTSGSTVAGSEGNGTIEFIGTYSSITFTTPILEDWYGFTLGESSVAVPLPASALSGGVLLAGVALVNNLRRRRQA